MASDHNQRASAITLFLAGEADTLALGGKLAPGLRPGMVIYLSGDLGAGKTTLVRGLLRTLGVKDRVKSPTFSLVEPYAISSLYLYHIDFYRLRSSTEWLDAGIDACFDEQAIVLIEWPEKGGEHLPAADVRITMKIEGDGRSATIAAETEAGKHCLDLL